MNSIATHFVSSDQQAVCIPAKWNCFKHPFEWEEARISYIDELATTAERQETLREDRFTTCQCKGCLDYKRDGDMTALVCPDEKCKGKLVKSREVRPTSGSVKAEC